MVIIDRFQKKPPLQTKVLGFILRGEKLSGVVSIELTILRFNFQNFKYYVQQTFFKK